MKRFTKFLFLTTSGIFLCLLSSCGENVCVAGLGQCEIPKEVRDQKIQNSNSPTAFSKLKAAIQTDRMSLNRGDQITIIGTGGKTPYSYSTDIGEIGEKDGLFKANTDKAAKAKITITDAAKSTTIIEIEIIDIQ